MYTVPQSKEMSSKVVSSRTSRTAASIGDSPASTRPFGKSQFRYALRSKNLSFLSSTLTTTTPADILVGGATDGMATLVGYTQALYSRRPVLAAAMSLQRYITPSRGHGRRQRRADQMIESAQRG